MTDRDAILDKLDKLADRIKSHPVATWPPGKCGDVTTHLAGVFLREHIGLVREAIRRLD